MIARYYKYLSPWHIFPHWFRFPEDTSAVPHGIEYEHENESNKQFRNETQLTEFMRPKSASYPMHVQIARFQ